MKKAILATKVGMTQIFNEDGVLVPVTVLQAGPCVVTQVKTQENLIKLHKRGRMLVASISSQDYPVVEAIVVILAFWVVLSGTLADLVNRCVDPRMGGTAK